MTRTSFSQDVTKVLPTAFSHTYLQRYVLTTITIIAMWLLPNVFQIPLELGLCVIGLAHCAKHRLSDAGWMLVMAYAHGQIHDFFPFLGYTGRVKGISTFLDVFCHFVMLLHANRMLGFSVEKMPRYDCWHDVHRRYYRAIWLFFVASSLFNVVMSGLIGTVLEDAGAAELVFDYSSFAQAISTAYWIAAGLVNATNSSSRLLIKYNWIFCILFVTVNFVAFRNNNHILGQTADHRYFASLDILPPLVGILFTPSARLKTQNTQSMQLLQRAQIKQIVTRLKH